LRIETAKTQRRDKAGQETGDQGERETEDENAPVAMNLAQTRQVGRRSSQQGVQAARGAGDAQQSANQAQYEALTENLASEFAGRGAESGADPPFAIAIGQMADPQSAKVDANDK
jgi:hypothetical protein